MQALLAVMQVVRVATLRSAQLPQPMAAAVVGLVRVVLLVVSVDAEAASVQREQLPMQQAHMVVAVVALPQRQPESIL